MRIQYGGLITEGPNDVRLAMTNTRNVVVRVEVGIAVPVVEPDTISTNEVDGSFIKQPVSGAEQPFASLKQGRLGLLEPA
jgi:hypothetical protein